MKDRKVKQVLSGGWYSGKGEDIGKGENIMYSCMKVEQ
jgi:hypothetical protein